MHNLIGLISILVILSLVIPSYGEVKFTIVIENENVNNDEEIDFENSPPNNKIIITNVTKTTTITIPPEKTEAIIKFEGDAIINSTVQFKNDVTINATNMNAVIEIKNNTKVSNDNWNGEFIFSKIGIETIPDQQNVVSFQVGNDLVSLSFDPPLKITFKDSANKNLFITSADERKQVKTVCDSSNVLLVENIPDEYPKSCYQNIGNDLITITKQASVFSTSEDKTITVKSEEKTTTKSSGGHGKTGVNTNPAINGKLKFEYQSINKVMLEYWAKGNLDDIIFYLVIDKYVTFDNDIHHSDDKKPYPNWIKLPTMWFVEGNLSSEEYIDMLRWLVDENIVN